MQLLIINRSVNLNGSVVASSYLQSVKDNLEAQDGGNFFVNLECTLSII